MKKKKPTVVTVLGILHIVFGSLSLLCNFCTGGAVIAGYFGITALYKSAPPESQRDLETLWKSLQDNVPGLIAMMFVDLIGSMLLGLILLIAGIGLLGVKSWARYLSVLWAVVRIVFLLALLAYNWIYVQPGMDKFNKDLEKWVEDLQKRQTRPGQPPPPRATMGGGLGGSADSIVNKAMSAISTAINGVYAFVVFVMMLLPSTAHAFARYNSGEDDYSYPSSEPRDDFDEAYERKRRELPPDQAPPL